MISLGDCHGSATATLGRGADKALREGEVIPWDGSDIRPGDAYVYNALERSGNPRTSQMILVISVTPAIIRYVLLTVQTYPFMW